MHKKSETMRIIDKKNEITRITKGRENNSRKARIGMNNNTKEETNKNPISTLTHENVEMKVMNPPMTQDPKKGNKV